MKRSLFGAVAAAAILAFSGAAMAAEADTGTELALGALVCHKTGTGDTYVIHSKIPVECTYHGVHGAEDYVGTTGILLGADLEIEADKVFAFTVVGGAVGIEQGGLSGHYIGAAASATAGVGVAAQAGLVGGGAHSFTLVPLGLGVQAGFGASAGISYLDITPKPLPPAPKQAAAAVVIEPPPAQPFKAAWNAFFDFDKSDLTPGGKVLVDQEAAALVAHHAAHVKVIGHGDTVGTRTYNYDLGLRRAEAVKAELVAKGVPAATIEVDSHGKYDLLVPTADQVREPMNRRALTVTP
jgi:outer membrane protein OmpA-like peptidoglycan-associated protein